MIYLAWRNECCGLDEKLTFARKSAISDNIRGRLASLYDSSSSSETITVSLENTSARELEGASSSIGATLSVARTETQGNPFCSSYRAKFAKFDKAVAIWSEQKSLGSDGTLRNNDTKRGTIKKDN